MNRQQWQEYFDGEFPHGLRVFRVEDVIERLPYTDFFLSARVHVLDASEEGTPTVQIWPVTGVTKEFSYTLSDQRETLLGGMLFDTDDSDYPFLVLDAEIPANVVGYLQEERIAEGASA